MFCLSTPQQGPINQRPLSLTPSSWSILVLFLFTEREQFIYQLPLQYLKTFKDTFCFVPSAAPLSRAFCFVGFFFFPVLAVHPLSLFTVCPLPLRPTISPSQLSVCFSPRFVILSYRQLLVPRGFLHLISA